MLDPSLSPHTPSPDVSQYPPPRRPAYPQAEAQQPWLAALFDAYHEIDLGVHEAVRREEGQGRRLACARGCAACCRSHTDIPLYPLELMGLYWYCIEELRGELRGRLRQQLAESRRIASCPFLVDDVCSVHPLRPMACRQFNVFDRPCAEGEDAYHSRRQDVMTPIRRFADAAFERLLPFYGVKSKRDRREAIRQGRIHALAQPLRGVDWSRLAARMEGPPGPADAP
ncbi:MAG: YkgJ family cysteine cluster protein [Bdellovibrio bacteriovorus]